MARIRQIKPEYWRSPDTAAASAVARLLYIAMWNWADDAGRGEADLKALEGFAFPNDDVYELSCGTSENFRHVLSEVQKCFGVVFYQVDGKPYYEIPSWADHQRNERIAKGKHPASNEGLTWDFMAEPTPGKTLRRKMSEVPKISDPVTEEQGDIGTGEQGNMDLVPATTPEPSRKAPARSNRFDDFWSVYPRKASKKAAAVAYVKAIKNVDEQTLIDAAIRYAQDPNRDPEYTKIPTTWLNGGCWDDDPLPPRNAPGAVASIASTNQNIFDAVSRIEARTNPNPTLGYQWEIEA